MNRSKKRKNRLFPMLITVMVLTAVLTPAAYADTDGTEPKITQQPDQLVLQLGTRWAGVEFELRTDAGIFPVPVVVDEYGYSSKEIGELLGAPANHVTAWISKARNHIRMMGQPSVSFRIAKKVEQASAGHSNMGNTDGGDGLWTSRLRRFSGCRITLSPIWIRRSR